MKTSITAFRLLALLLALSTVSSARAALLSDLLAPGSFFDNGDKRFSNFTYSFTGDMPDPTHVNVTPFTDIFGNFGLEFQGPFLDLPGASGSDALINYVVTVLNPGFLITGANMSGNPKVLGGPGTISVDETFVPDDVTASLTIFDNIPGSSQLSDSTSFATGHSSLHVQKDIFAQSADLSFGVPTLSFVTQTFCQSPVPEPSTVTLLGAGLAALTLWRLRRRKQA